MDWVFFADDIYTAINGILFTVFTTLYGDFTDGLRLFINLFFHVFIVFYAFMSFKNGYFSSLFSLFRSIILLAGTFNLSFNSTHFKTYIFDFVLNFPIKFASFLVNSTISSNIPNFKSLVEFDTSALFASLTTTLVNRAQSETSMFGSMPNFTAVYLYVVVVLVVILYYAFWLIQFGFLIQAAIYLILGIPILNLLAFRETQHIFFEWLRAIVTIMLHPIMAAIVIYIILNFLNPLSSDIQTVVNSEQVGLSAVGTLFATLIFGIFALRYIPSMAAILTRGSMAAADSPLKSATSFGRSSITNLAGKTLSGLGAGLGKMSTEISRPSARLGQPAGGSNQATSGGAGGGASSSPVVAGGRASQDSIQSLSPSGVGKSASSASKTPGSGMISDVGGNGNQRSPGADSGGPSHANIYQRRPAGANDPVEPSSAKAGKVATKFKAESSSTNSIYPGSTNLSGEVSNKSRSADRLSVTSIRPDNEDETGLLFPSSRDTDQASMISKGGDLTRNPDTMVSSPSDGPSHPSSSDASFQTRPSGSTGPAPSPGDSYQTRVLEKGEPCDVEERFNKPDVSVVSRDMTSQTTSSPSNALSKDGSGSFPQGAAPPPRRLSPARPVSSRIEDYRYDAFKGFVRKPSSGGVTDTTRDTSEHIQRSEKDSASEPNDTNHHQDKKS